MGNVLLGARELRLRRRRLPGRIGHRARKLRLRAHFYNQAAIAIGHTLHVPGKYEGAALTIQRVRSIEEVYGTDDPRLKPVWEQAGTIYMGMDRHEEASHLFAVAGVLSQEAP